MQRVAGLLVLLLFCGVRGTASQPSDGRTQIEAQVLRDFLRDVPASEKDIGLDCPREDLGRLQHVFAGGRVLLTIKEYAAKHPNASGIAPVFWLRLSSRTADQAQVEAGTYPLVVMTRYGRMPRYNTDWLYRLARRRGEWIIVSYEITGES